MTRLTFGLVCAVALGSASFARAQEPLRITLPSIADDDITSNAVESADERQARPARPVAIEYSDAYYTRAKIHKYASFATLPLFATEIALASRCTTAPDRTRSAPRTPSSAPASAGSSR